MSNLTKQDFPWCRTFTPRWRDNDQYGHINNAVYYEYFDSTANLFLIQEAKLDVQNSSTIAYVVYSQCQYFAPVAYPQDLEIGLSVKKLGNSSVTWHLGLFCKDDEHIKAEGEFVHVFVDRETGAKTTIPANIREKLQSIVKTPTE